MSKILSAPSSYVLIAIGVVIGVAGFALFDSGGGNDGAAQSFRAPFAPVEFLYLDKVRIANYLAQLEGGRAGAERRIVKETKALHGEGGTAGFKVGASSQTENSAESTLVRTASSEFELMLRDLRENPLSGVSVHPVDLGRPADLGGLEEGWLVRFTTSDLLSPGYIRPYVVVRQSATLAALFSDATAQRRRAKSFARQIGPNPRITFVVSPPDNPLKVLLPMQYEDLTNERSLLEKGRDRFTGGRLVVVGKVIRLFPARKDPCLNHTQVCTQRLPDYTDFATQEIWRHPLEGASNYLIERVSHNCGLSYREIEGETRSVSKLEGRECLLGKLQEQTRLYAPGAVILPIAVYK